jgi:hypothetical protein
MVYQEDIMEYFEKVAVELREKNIPIFNKFVSEYPGFIDKESARKQEEILEDNDENEFDYEEEILETTQI